MNTNNNIILNRMLNKVISEIGLGIKIRQPELTNSELRHKERMMKEKIKMFRMMVSSSKMGQKTNCIEPKIKYLNTEPYHSKEVLKFFQDGILTGFGEKLSLKEILALNLPDTDKKEFIKIFCPEFRKLL